MCICHIFDIFGSFETGTGPRRGLSATPLPGRTTSSVHLCFFASPSPADPPPFVVEAALGLGDTGGPTWAYGQKTGATRSLDRSKGCVAANNGVSCAETRLPQCCAAAGPYRRPTQSLTRPRKRWRSEASSVGRGPG
eukprot:gene17976-biopygen14446